MIEATLGELLKMIISKGWLRQGMAYVNNLEN